MMTSMFGFRALIACLVALAAIGWSTAAKAAPDLSVYGNLPGFERAALSPSGNRIAIIGTIDGTRRLIVQDKAGKLLNASGVGDNKVRGLLWAGEDRLLVWVSATVPLGLGFTTNKAELSTMIVIPIDGGKTFHIFAGNKSITGGINGFYGIYEREGHWYGYFGGITLQGDGRSDPYLSSTNPDLYEVDLDTGRPNRIAKHVEDEDSYRDWLVGPDGKVAATLDFMSKNGDWRIRTANGGSIASGRNPLGGVGLVSFGRTPGTFIYARADASTGASRWFEQPLTGGAPTEILADEGSSGSFIDRRSGALIGHVVEGDDRAITLYAPRQAKVIAATARAFPDLRLTLVDWNDSFDRLLVRTDGTGDPGTWWLVDIPTGDAKRIGSAYGIRSVDVGPVRMFKYKAADGLEISGVLTLPPGREAKGLPVVVLPHGGPAARDYPEFDWWAQAFASRGYAVFQPNFRGSTGYGVSFEKAGHGEWGRKMQTDVSDGLAALAKEGIVDPARACIMGASYGGYAALAGVTLQKGLYRCAVSVAGVSDVSRMYASDVYASGGDQTLIRALKDEVGSGRDLKTVSPVNFAAQADAPVLLIHGKDDTVVLYEQSTAMERALRKAGKPVELVTLAGEDHNLSRSVTRLAMLQAAVAFVERHNPPAAKAP